MTYSSTAPVVRIDRLSALLQAVTPRVLTDSSAPDGSQTLILYMQTDANNVPTHVSLGATGLAPHGPHTALHVALDGPAAPLLLHEFKSLHTVTLGNQDSGLLQAAQLLQGELCLPRCGHEAMLASAATALLIGVLRGLVADPHRGSGLFVGLSDRRLAAALVAMHEAPQNDWTLASLAQHAGISRTVFATQFKMALGVPPGRFLAQLRLLIARRAVESGQGLKAAARAAGYVNTSALSRALARVRTGAI